MPNQRSAQDETWTQGELILYAETEGDWRIPLEPDRFRWSYVRHFPTKEFTQQGVAINGRPIPPDEWEAWLLEEKANADFPEYYQELEAAWLNDPAKVGPVLLAYMPGKRMAIGDGWHRIAMAVVNKMKSVPAIVGRPK